MGLERQRARELEILRQQDLEIEIEKQRRLEEELNRKSLKQIEEERLKELAKKKLEEEKQAEKEREERILLERKRLIQIEETLKATEREVAKIQKEFEEAGRRRFLALKKLEETKQAYQDEADKIKEERELEDLKKRKQVLEAVDTLADFLNPDSESGRSLETPDHIWTAIIELSEVLESQKGNNSESNESLSKVMKDIVSAAGRKIRIRTKIARKKEDLGRSLQIESFPL